MKKVLTYGTFDLFHVGHVRLLRRLRSLGDCLVVGLSTDEFNLSKGKKSVYSYEERKEILESCKFVDLVIPEKSWEQKKGDIQKHNIDIFGMGDDWQGKFDDLSSKCEVIYLERTENVSTTDVKQQMRKLDTKKIEQLEESVFNALELLKSISNTVESSGR